MPPHAKPKKARKIKPGSSPTYLDQIRRLPCCLSGGPAEAAHIRFASAEHGKPEAGMGAKPADCWVVPLSPLLHRLATESQHAGNERAFWQQFGVDVLALAQNLWKHRDSRITMERYVIMFQPWDQKIKTRIMEIMRNERPDRRKA